MDLIVVCIGAFITVFSVGLLSISLLSYRQYHNTKLLFVSVVFLLFFIKGIVYSLDVFIDVIPTSLTGSYAGLFDIGILCVLFLATLKR